MKSIKRVAILLFSLSIIYTSFAQIPLNYYNQAEGKQEAALKTSLKNIISFGHTINTYSSLWEHFELTDKRSDGFYFDIYSNCNFNYNSSHTGTTACSAFNREHSFPKSWFGNTENTHQYSDLFHLYPTDASVNSKRSNYPYGIVAVASYTSSNGSKLGSSNLSTSYGGTVFEPADEYKGDLARTYFYMITRYEDLLPGWNYGSPMINQTTYPGFTAWALNLLLDWARQDPVSEKEINRNNAIYKIQHNRNPFIDYPQLAEHVWGTKTTEKFFSTNSTEPAVYLSNLYFPDTEKGSQTTHYIHLTGVNLTSNIQIRVDGTYFSMDISEIELERIIGGVDIPIRFFPLKSGNYQAKVQISGGGLRTELTYLVFANAPGGLEVCNLPTDDSQTSLFQNFSTNNLNSLSNWNRFAVKGSDISWVDKSYSGDYYIYISSYKASENNYEIWLLTPALNFDLMERKYLAFESAVSYYSSNSDLKLFVVNCVDGQTKTTELSFTKPTASNANYEWVKSGEIDLSQFSGIGYIGFVYTSSSNSDTGNYQIDDIQIGNFPNSLPEIYKTYKRQIVQANRIELNHLSENIQIEIFDLTGKKIFSQKGNQTIQLPTSNPVILRFNSEF